ncbi:MAG TPA: ATP-dependent metallopeptidase FtsH/Yme1/Tma family protein, partial [Acidimicrobiia bacterium]
MSIILVAILFSWWFDQVAGPEEISISQFVENVEEGEYEEVVLLARSKRAQGREVGSDTEEGAFDQVASYVEGYETELTNTLNRTGTTWDVDEEPAGFFELLIGFLPWLFLLGFMVFIFMQMQGGGNRVMQFGKSKAKTVGK